MANPNPSLEQYPEVPEVAGICGIHQEVIGGLLYETKILPATEGLIILPKLMKLIGKHTLNMLLEIGVEDSASLLNNAEVASAMLCSIAENAAEDDGFLIVRRMLKQTTCDKIKIGDNYIKGNVADHFDRHFAARYTHLLEVCVWVARVSFGNL